MSRPSPLTTWDPDAPLPHLPTPHAWVTSERSVLDSSFLNLLFHSAYYYSLVPALRGRRVPSCFFPVPCPEHLRFGGLLLIFRHHSVLRAITSPHAISDARKVVRATSCLLPDTCRIEHYLPQPRPSVVVVVVNMVNTLQRTFFPNPSPTSDSILIETSSPRSHRIVAKTELHQPGNPGRWPLRHQHRPARVGYTDGQCAVVLAILHHQSAWIR